MSTNLSRPRSLSFRRELFVILLSLLVGLVWALASGALKTWMETPRVGPGEAIVENDFEIVALPPDCPFESTRGLPPFFGELCSVDLQGANLSDEARKFGGRIDVYVGGERYPALARRGPLFERRLFPHTRAEGTVIFDVPPGSALTRLEIDSDRDGETIIVEDLSSRAPP